MTPPPETDDIGLIVTALAWTVVFVAGWRQRRRLKREDQR